MARLCGQVARKVPRERREYLVQDNRDFEWKMRRINN
jgi:hypothetical protein